MSENDNEEISGGHACVSDVIHGCFNPPQHILIKASDGMPVEADPPWTPEQATPPPLTPDYLVCMAQPAKEGREYDLPSCKHYARQKGVDETIPVYITMRWCTHGCMRSLSGAALSLRDTAMIACELREPRDPATDALLDKDDEKRVKLGGKRVGYRLYKTPEDVAAGKTSLNEEEWEPVKGEW